jgi:hypothetical protein
MSEVTAQVAMVALRSGRTLNSMCSKRQGKEGWITYRSQFQAYYAIHPEYASEANALQVENTKAMNARKGPPLTHCVVVI